MMKKLILLLLAVAGSVQLVKAYDFELKIDTSRVEDILYFNILSTGNPNDKYNDVKSEGDTPWNNWDSSEYPSATCEITYKSVAQKDGIWVYNDDYNYTGKMVGLSPVVQYNGKRYRIVGVGAHAFENCTKLTECGVPEDISYIGNSAFKGCSSLKGEFVMPTTVTEIADSVFYGCEGISSLSISNNITKIGRAAYYGCTALAQVSALAHRHFLEVSVGENAFYHQTDLGYKCKLIENGWLVSSEQVMGVYPWNKFEVEAPKYDWNKPNAINDVAVNEGAQEEYYNLQGVKIAAPQSGEIVIKRQGSTVTKVIVK